MVDQDILIEKIKNIQICLDRIREKVDTNLKNLNHLDVQDIVVLNIQRATQLTIDIASHIVTSENLGAPTTLKETFKLLQNRSIISADLSEKLQKMVGFRNIAVHDYESIDERILHLIITEHLVDFEEFYSLIIKKYIVSGQA